MEMNALELSVITQDGVVFETNVHFVKFFTQNGELGIFPGHTRTISLLNNTDVVYEFEPEKERCFYVGNGIVSITKNKVTILTDTYLNAVDLDKLSIENALKQQEQSRSDVLALEAQLRVLNFSQA